MLIISHRSPLQEEDCRLDRLGFVGVALRAKRQGSDRRAAVTPMVSGAGIATRGLHGRPTRAGRAIALGFTSAEAGTANDLPVTRITRSHYDKTIQSYIGLESSSGIGSEFGRCSGNSPGDRRKFTDSIGSLPGVRRKLAGGIGGLLGVCRELAEGNRGLLGAHRKLESLPRVRQSSPKMIESLPECTRGRR
ncbi:hypothetical protein GW17_00000795 [Ensete ventricosum]|nr:hypothetical protein GW17_00000795 [Ensete ventricosum]